MDHTELAKLKNDFRSFGMRDRQAVLNALVEAFRPSDYRHLAHLFMPGRFVGDLVQVLPAEISDKIFGYCEPQDIFKLKSVSGLWNSYLSRPEFQQRMNQKMYGDSGGYRLDSGCVYTEKASFEERVRTRCALLNGHPQTFEYIHHTTKWGEGIQYCSGILIECKCPTPTIYVRQLYKNEVGWRSVVGDDLETFACVKITPKHILATTTQGVVYCWSAATLEKLAKFRLPSAPFMIDASSNTVLMFCDETWFLYSLESKTLTRMHPLATESLTQYRPSYGTGLWSCRLEQSGFLYGSDGRDIEVFKINETSTSIDFVERFDVYKLKEVVQGVPAEDIDFVVVWDHQCYHSYSHPSHYRPILIFELKNGNITYHHTIENKHLKIKDVRDLVYFPQQHRAFNFECESASNMPLGMYQIYENSYRGVLSGQETKPAQADSIALRLSQAWRKDPDDDLFDAAYMGNWSEEPAVWTGDTNYLVCTNIDAVTTRLWRFRGTVEGPAEADE